MSARSRRPLSLTNLRAFETVARTLNFGAAAEELHVTQSAVSRQIKGLEDELGAQLFQRGTRHVQITPDGQTLLRTVEPLARQARRQRAAHPPGSRSRQRVSVTTFASFGSLWLLPRIEAFQRSHPDIDIRVSAHDALDDLDDPELDLALRYCNPAQAPAGGVHLFDDTLTPAVSRSLWQQIKEGKSPPLAHRRRSAPPDAARGGRRPRQHRVPELAPLARTARRARARAEAMALPQLHLPAGAGRARRPRRGTGAGAAGVRGAAARRAGRALRRSGPGQEPVLVLDAGRAGQPGPAGGGRVHALGRGRGGGDTGRRRRGADRRSR